MSLVDEAARIFDVPVADPPYFADSYPQQLAFIKDPSKRKCALAGRRAFKSHGVALWLMHGALQVPRELSVYIARSSGHARRILWGKLQQINRKYKLGFRFQTAPELRAIAPNGHAIWLTGAANVAEIEKLRGPYYYRVVIDECGSIGPSLLATLIDDILDPALMDLDGDMALVGTPGLVAMGPWFDRTTPGPAQWPTHEGTCLENPYVNGKAYIERKKRENHWADDNPTLLREYHGKWVVDKTAVVYPYDVNKNRFYDDPEGEYLWGIAVDPGAGEAQASTGFTVGFIRRGHPELYIDRSFKLPLMTPNKIAARIEVLKQELESKWGRVGPMVLDEGALGRGYGDQLRDEGIPITAAKKANKLAYQERFRGRMQSGMIRVRHSGSRGPQPCDDLTDEWSVIRRDPKTGRDDPNYPNHCADATLYLDRALAPYYRPEMEPPREGSEEWFRAEAAKLKEETRRNVQRENRKNRQAWARSRWR